jgi:hypothetical protein
VEWYGDGIGGRKLRMGEFANSMVEASRILWLLKYTMVISTLGMVFYDVITGDVITGDVMGVDRFQVMRVNLYGWEEIFDGWQ